MRLIDQVIFFSIVFAIYGSINYYVGIRAISVLPAGYKTQFLIVYIFIVSAYVAGRIIESYYPSIYSTALIWVGSFWIAFMVYFFLSALFIDLIRLANHFLGFLPDFITANPVQTKRIVSISVLVLTALTIIGGHINTKFIKTKKLDLKIAKAVPELDSLNIVLASDIHLGVIVGETHLKKIVDKINGLQPDVILLAGDIIDEDVAPVIRNNVGEQLKKLSAKYGVYGITGNHEYIGGVEPASKYLIEHGIGLLRDSTVFVDKKFFIVGREDRAISQFTNSKRKQISRLFDAVDKSYPVILMDHQPFALHEAKDMGVDLQVSGHTHYGQMWPLNFITDWVYELAWGYKQKGNTHYYVSCGAGGWGPPIRTGSRPEIVQIMLSFR